MPITKARLRISDYNKQRKASLKKQQRRIAMVSLSLTSMVDMFAILVIFLLTNTSAITQWVEVGQGIKLPRAHSADPVPRGVTVQVTASALFGDKQELISVTDIVHGPMSIQPLKAWLEAQSKKDAVVNLVGHEAVPFGTMRKVVATCQDAGYTNVNLAVQPKN